MNIKITEITDQEITESFAEGDGFLDGQYVLAVEKGGRYFEVRVEGDVDMNVHVPFNRTERAIAEAVLDEFLRA